MLRLQSSVRFVAALVVCLIASSAATAQGFVSITTLARATKAHDLLKEPQAVAIDTLSGIVFVADSGHHQIAAIDASGNVTVLAGSGIPGNNDGIGTAAQFNRPQGIAIDSSRRHLYVADTANHVIRRVTFDGVVTSFVGSGRAEDRDGSGSSAGFNQPVGLALDSTGDLYVADSGNDKIRKVTPSGIVSTLAGAGRPGYSDGNATESLFNGPRGVAVSPLGAVYVADTQNHVVRKVVNGAVSTLAGTTHAGATDGRANVAEFKQPSGVALSEAGDVWVADLKNHQIRRIAVDGATTTIAGIGKPGYGDTTDLLQSQFHEPAGVAVAGAVFIADSKNDAVRMLVPSVAATDLQPRSGSPGGGQAVRIFGAGFIPGRTEVTFGGVAASIINYISSTELMVLTPARPIGDAEVRVSTLGGTAALPFPFRFIPPFVSIQITPATAALDVGKTLQLIATGFAPDNATSDLTNRVTWSSANPPIVTIDASGLARAVSPGSTTLMATFESLSDTASISVRQPEPLPPNPVPTPIDPTVVSDMSRSVQFLYTGPNAIQKNVAPGAINTRRVAVLRGRVLAADGSPMAGVRVTDNRSFFGFTLTRSDGWYDFAVNGGGEITLVFTKTGLIQAQRRTSTPWRDYVVLDDVYMMNYDAYATLVQMNATSTQIVRGGQVVDTDGSRRATLFLPPGTSATIQTSSGLQPAPSLTIRATEYSVGPNGHNLMPADLPPTSAYTYCVELSADEAVAVNALSVNFSRPLSFYVDNFLEFPVGTIVPVGYYDRLKSRWIASENGVVMRVLTTSGVAATVDVTGDGVADDVSAIGVTADELQMLAGTYKPDQTLWRAQIKHFTPWDLNFPYAPPVGAVQPQQPQPIWYKGVEEPETRCGSTIDCHNQVFGEAIPIAGTPFALQYQSDHAPGYKAGHSVDIQISGSKVPVPLKRIDVEVSVQGRISRRSFPAAPNQTYRFTWDGLDAYGRVLQGMQVASIRIGYAYEGVYAEPADITRSFASVAGIPLSINRTTRREFTFWQEQGALVGSFDDKPLGFGGWTLSAVKTIEPTTGIVRGGAGGQRSGDLQRNMIDRFAGGGTSSGTGDFGFARDAKFLLPWAVAVAPNGTVYISDSNAGTIRHVATNGLITTFASNVGNVTAMTVGPDEALYYASAGKISRRSSSSGATVLAEGFAEAMAFGPDGSLYLGGSGIRRLGADGALYDVTGSATPVVANPEGRAALSTNVGAIAGLAVADDGTVYFSRSSRIFSIAPDGVIRRFAGKGVRFEPYGGDGGPAVAATIDTPSAVAIGPDGSVYFADWGYSTIRRVFPNGIVKTIAGIPFEHDGLRNGGPAAAASVFSPRRLAVGPDGSVYVTDQFYMTVRRISPPDSLANTSEYRVPSQDGGTLDVFGGDGRHLRTIDTVTGVAVRTLSYEANYLTSISDAYGNVTRVERGAGGDVKAIISPFGKRTTLVTNGNGYLESVTNPAGAQMLMTYADGQVTSVTNGRSIAKTITYDADGLLLREQLPDGGGTILSREGRDTDATIRVESGQGVVSTYKRTVNGAARETRVDVDAVTGLRTTTQRDDTDTSTSVLPDGTTVTSAVKGDPRFATLAPLRFGSIRTPAGLTLSVDSERSVTLSNKFDPLSLTSISETFTVNGRTWKSMFHKASRAVTTVTPAGRQSTATLNATGDIAQMQVPGFASAAFTYDSRGRMTELHTGSRVYTIAYNATGEIERVTDPLTRSLTFEYDRAGRVTRQLLSDTRSIGLSYDNNGNVTSVSPPARPAHGFDYTLRDLVDRYTPPAATSASITQYQYNRDRRLNSVDRGAGLVTTFNYDDAGRLENVVTPDGTYNYAYGSTGTLASIIAPGGEHLTYTYDGNLVTEVGWSGDVTGAVSFQYDDSFRVVSENGISYRYDPDNLLIGAGALSLSNSSQNGLLAGSSLGAVIDSYSYNEYGEMMRYVASIGTTNLLTADVARDAAGRITSINQSIGDDPSRSVTYEYDSAGRLMRVNKHGTPTSEYDYDANSNRTVHKFIGGSSVATYDAQDRLLSYDDTTYTYNSSGELKSKTAVGHTTSFNYDVFGNLRSVQIPGRAIDYVVDAQNRRIGKKVNGALVQGWLYAGQIRVVAELDSESVTSARFVYGSRPNVPDYLIKNDVTYRILSDHLGSPRLVVNVADGTVAQRLDYDEFGRVLLDTNPGFQPFGFAGGLYDRDTGLLRFGARDYDPQTGRWTAKDPLGFSAGDTNLYNYVFGDPINSIDPTGLATVLGKASNPYTQKLKNALERVRKELRDNPSPACDAYFQAQTNPAFKDFRAALLAEGGPPYIMALDKPQGVGSDTAAYAPPREPFQHMVIFKDFLDKNPIGNAVPSVIMHELGHLARKDTRDNEPQDFFKACTCGSLNPGSKK